MPPEVFHAVAAGGRPLAAAEAVDVWALGVRSLCASGSRADIDIANMKDYFLGLAYGKLRYYGKHCSALIVHGYLKLAALMQLCRASARSKLPCDLCGQLRCVFHACIRQLP